MPAIVFIMQRSLQSVLIFRLLLKITVERFRECIFTKFLTPHGDHFEKGVKTWQTQKLYVYYSTIFTISMLASVSSRIV